jgi:hypothetical protein
VVALESPPLPHELVEDAADRLLIRRHAYRPGGQKSAVSAPVNATSVAPMIRLMVMCPL